MNSPAIDDRDGPRIHLGSRIDLAPGRVRVGGALVFEPERAHDKFRSSGLFVAGPWREIEPTDDRVTADAMQRPDDGVGVLRFSENLTDRLTRWASTGGFTGAPEQLEKGLRRALAGELDAAASFRVPLEMEPSAVTLRSDPAAGTSSGLTTNGLHFDDPLPGAVRIGVNLGPVDRFVYVVLRRRRTIPQAASCDESGDGYGPLAQAGLAAMSIRVRPGEGWTMPTTELLHDGRRAESVGISQFMLAIGRFDV